MKKISLFFITALLLAALCVGCTPAEQPQPEFDNPYPWYSYRNFVSETSSYKVSKHFLIDQENEILVTDQSSNLVYKLTEWTETDGTALCKVETSFTITYNDSDYIESNYRGKTDTITSEVVFRKDNLACVTSQKTVNLASNPQTSYSYLAKYNEGVATMTKGGSEHTLTFAKGNYIDNEYLYYYVRSMKSVGSSMYQTFSIVNIYECFLRGEFGATSMTASFDSAEGIDAPQNVLDGVDASGKDSETGKLLCNLIKISLSGDKTGAPLYAYYSSAAYNDGVGLSKKILTRIRNFENTLDGIVTYRTDFNLDSYNIEYKA